MASFIDDLGSMLQAALRANIASFGSAIDTPNGTANIYFDYTRKSGGNMVDADNCCNINFVGRQPVTRYEASGQSVFTFSAWFQFHDPEGANKAPAYAYAGMENTFAKRGRTCLETYLTDNGSNWLGESGHIDWTWELTPIEQLADRDQPEARSNISITIDHKIPLS